MDLLHSFGLSHITAASTVDSWLHHFLSLFVPIDEMMSSFVEREVSRLVQRNDG
jgi:hypothetical protein